MEIVANLVQFNATASGIENKANNSAPIPADHSTWSLKGLLLSLRVPPCVCVSVRACTCTGACVCVFGYESLWLQGGVVVSTLGQNAGEVLSQSFTDR